MRLCHRDHVFRRMKSALKMAWAGFRFEVDVLPSCTQVLGTGFPVDLGGATEPYAAFRTESRITVLTGATLQEIRGHEGWDYGALLRAQNGDKWLRWAHSRIFTQRPKSRKAVRVDDAQACHPASLLAHGLRA
jgi:hypothetical protein